MQRRRYTAISVPALVLACAAWSPIGHAEMPFGTVHCGFGPGTLSVSIQFGPEATHSSVGAAIRDCHSRGGNVQSVNLFSLK